MVSFGFHFLDPTLPITIDPELSFLVALRPEGSLGGCPFLITYLNLGQMDFRVAGHPSTSNHPGTSSSAFIATKPGCPWVFGHSTPELSPQEGPPSPPSQQYGLPRQLWLWGRMMEITNSSLIYLLRGDGP